MRERDYERERETRVDSVRTEEAKGKKKKKRNGWASGWVGGKMVRDLGFSFLILLINGRWVARLSDQKKR